MESLYCRFPERRALFDALESIADQSSSFRIVRFSKELSRHQIDYRFAKNIDVQWADSSDAFVQSVNALVGGSGGKIPNKIILIVQHVELLRTKSTSVLKLLLKLNELAAKWCKFSFMLFQKVHILHYVFHWAFHKLVAELVSKLSLRRPPDVDEKIYHLYVQLTVDVLHKSCRDPAAISYLLDKNLQPFLETLGDVSALSEGALSTHVWRALQPELSKSAGSLQVPEATMNWELPMHAKFLLIAAYIASYNPPKSDRRFFLKKGEKTKISRRELHWDDRKSAHVSGPSAFPLERMLAIFTIIIGKPVEITVEIFGLVGTLRTLGYVSQTSNDCNLDSIRLRCLATYETVSEIARQVVTRRALLLASIDFDLPNYLYDFVNLKLY
ncbi:hypothetical protein D918_09806 [Trichuris suis]|nr:hypothetical protein D918_09806 [Trichuris suis]